MADIFLSYSRKNAKVVRELVRHLENQGWSVFWDRDMVAGSQFDRNLEEELNKAKIVLVVWSKDSVESSWVRAEANTGLERGCLVPVRLDDSLLPLIFRSTETISLIEWPMQSRALELRKLTLSLKTRIEVDLNDENSESNFKSVPVRDDPTLSTRVAKKVVHSLHRDSNLEQLQYQLAFESAISDSAIEILSGANSDSVTGNLAANLREIISAEWGILKTSNLESYTGAVDSRLEKLDRIRESTVSGIQPIDISSPNKGYCLRVVSDNKSEMLFVLDHYPDIKQDTINRLKRFFSAVCDS